MIFLIKKTEEELQEDAEITTYPTDLFDSQEHFSEEISYDDLNMRKLSEDNIELQEEMFTTTNKDVNGMETLLPLKKTKINSEIWDEELPEDAEEEGFDSTEYASRTESRPQTVGSENDINSAPYSARSVDSYGSAGSGTYESPVASPKGHHAEEISKDTLLFMFKDYQVKFKEIFFILQKGSTKKT